MGGVARVRIGSDRAVSPRQVSPGQVSPGLSGVPFPGPFCVCVLQLKGEPGRQKQRVRILREVVDFMKYEWHLQMPSVIISVTGNALPFTLRPKYLELFTTALLNATRSTNAWIVTGGCGAGIMKLVGDAFARYERPLALQDRGPRPAVAPPKR